MMERPAQMIQGGTGVKATPKPTTEEYKFKSGDRVTLQSIKERPITGTVRWVGPMTLSREIGGPQVIAVGVETDKKIQVKEEFPDLSLDVTGSHGQNIFSIASGHSRVYLPEQLVVHAKDYAQQQQIQEEKIAKDYGITLEEYRAQQEMLEQANRARDMKHRERMNLAFEDEKSTYTYSKIPDLPFLPTSSGGLPTQDSCQFAVGSRVSVSTQRSDPLHGVVMWIGALPDIPGVIAGLELDNSLVGCTDGTWQGKRHFNCPPGRAFFCPITNLRLDTRYIDQGQIPAAAREYLQNPLKDLVPQFEEDDTLVTPDLFTKYIGDKHGIQGHHNSCYLDATVFGLFALSDSFDMILLLEEPNDHVGQKIKHILWKGIVNPLRKYGLVRYESVMELCNSLEEFGRIKGTNRDEKDPEEFLNLLFKEILHVKPFLSIKRPFGVEKEYFIQLFFEIDLQQNELPETEKLITQMFHEQKISFTNVPSKLLLQMPRFGKDFKMYNRTIPSLTINVKPLLDPSARGIQKCHFCLSSTATTICYNCPKYLYHIDEPYVFYCSNCCETLHKNRKDHHCEDVKLKQDNIGDVSQISRSQNRWLFHDSMANRLYDMYYIPKVVDVTQDIQDWIYNPDNRQKLKHSPAKSIPEFVRCFTQDIYMCIYVNSDLDLYGEVGDSMESLQGGGHSQ